jgi:hypothetical protein
MICNVGVLSQRQMLHNFFPHSVGVLSRNRITSVVFASKRKRIDRHPMWHTNNVFCQFIGLLQLAVNVSSELRLSDQVVPHAVSRMTLMQSPAEELRYSGGHFGHRDSMVFSIPLKSVVHSKSA